MKDLSIYRFRNVAKSGSNSLHHPHLAGRYVSSLYKPLSPRWSRTFAFRAISASPSPYLAGEMERPRCLLRSVLLSELVPCVGVNCPHACLTTVTKVYSACGC